MPTGYTAPVKDGKITKFSDFALQCARAFGALIEMRDEPSSAPIPSEFKPSSYHLDAMKAAEDEYADLREMTAAKAEREAQKAHKKLLAAHESYEAEKRQERARYEAMLVSVKEWKPPTKDHVELKKFMNDQLVGSIEFDCGSSRQPPKAKTGSEWLHDEITRVRRDIEYHKAEHAKDVERANNRTEWVKQLRKSLAA